jgi:Domain of unknown function (DUF4390)
MQRTGLIVATLLCAMVVPAAAQQPSPRIALTDDASPHAVFAVESLLANGDFIGAMESGFPLYVEFTIALRESKSLWDRDVKTQTFEYVILFDPVRERYVLEDAKGTEIIRTRDLLARRVAEEYEIVLVPETNGNFYYRLSVDVRTLDDSDVDEVFAWLKGEDVDTDRPDRPGALTRAARRLLVAVAPLPSVHLEARTSNFSRQ